MTDFFINYPGTEVFFKMVLSFVLGLIIGIEREFAGKEAGPRTYSLVSLGSTIFTILSFNVLFGGDNARMISQIIPGIGFIGAGLIIFHQNKVRGLSTATGIWVMASVGIAIGMGEYSIALFGGFLTLMALYILRKMNIEDYIDKKRKQP